LLELQFITTTTTKTTTTLDTCFVLGISCKIHHAAILFQYELMLTSDTKSMSTNIPVL